MTATSTPSSTIIDHESGSAARSHCSGHALASELARRSTSAHGRWLAVLLAVLAGCGGGGGGDAVPDPGPAAAITASHLPLAAGDQWLYRDQSGALERVKVAGTRTVAGELATVLVSKVPGNTDFEETLLVKTATEVKELHASNVDPLLRAIGDTVVMRLPLARGGSFLQVDRTVDSVDVDGDGRADRVTVRAVSELVAVEPVSTEAAAFPEASRLRTTVSLSIQSTLAGRTVASTGTVDEWYVSNIGLVRDESRVVVDGLATVSTRNLVAYSVGGRRSESVAPTVSGSTPAAGSTVPLQSQYFITFSEPIDPDVVGPQSVRLVDASGRQLNIESFFNDRQLIVNALPAAGTGTYRIEFGEGVRDFAGNPLASAALAFTIDASAPAMVRATPTDGSRYVALDTQVVIGFDEDLDFTDIATGRFSLTALPITADVAVEVIDARTVRLRPAAPLKRATEYTVRAQFITDRVGNRSFQSGSFTFTTDPGIFDYPRTVRAGVGLSAVAIGDVTGDGRDDLVYQLMPSPDQPGGNVQLVVVPQRADGQLGAESVTSTAPNLAAVALAIAIADINGDGRKDVVVGEDGLSIALYIQGGQGTLVRSQVLPASESVNIHAVDLNGDGRTDILATSHDQPTLAIWLQQPDGSFAGPQRMTVPGVVIRDLVVSDLNADGRLDLALIINTVEPTMGSSVLVIRQRADGGFDAPVALPFSSYISVAGLAVGDLDNDGRPDLVAVDFFAAMRQFRQAADGSFIPGPLLALPFDNITNVRIADFDRDGRNDLVLGCTRDGEIALLRQRPDATLGEPELFSTQGGCSSWQGLAVGDLNGDGRPDVVTSALQVMLDRSHAVGTGAAGIALALKPATARGSVGLGSAKGVPRQTR